MAEGGEPAGVAASVGSAGSAATAKPAQKSAAKNRCKRSVPLCFFKARQSETLRLPKVGDVGGPESRSSFLSNIGLAMLVEIPGTGSV